MTKDEALQLAHEGIEIHSPDDNEYKVCAALIKALETKDEPRTWVGLTDEEKAQFVVAYYPSNWDRKTAVSLMNDYEKYLKEKNHV